METPYRSQESEQYSVVFDHSVRPLEVTIDPSEKASLARSVVTGIDRLLLETKIDFSEVIETVEPIVLDNSPDPLPDWEVRSVISRFYNRAHVRVEYEVVDSERRLIQASIHLFDNMVPEQDTTTLFILADETTTEVDISPSDPQFYAEVPSIVEEGKKDLIPLDYKNLQKILNELVAQSNIVAAFESTDRNITESLNAILATCPERHIHQGATYKFSPLPELGHSTVSFSRDSRVGNNTNLPTSSQYSVKTMTTHYLDPSGHTSTECLFDVTNSNATARVGVEYIEIFDKPAEVTTREELLGKTIGQWQTDRALSELESYDAPTSSSRSNSRFTHYILQGMSSIGNLSTEEIEQSRLPIQE